MRTEHVAHGPHSQGPDAYKVSLKRNGETAASSHEGQRRPTAGEWRRLCIVAGGVVIGFPLCSAIAMRSLPASHAAILIGLMPLATTAAAAWLAHEQPSRGCRAEPAVRPRSARR